MKINPKASEATIAATSPRTAEGAIAKRITPEQQLRRSVMANMLWESAFYEEGTPIAKRISDLVGKVDGQTVSDIAIEARERMKLRHVPLLLARSLVSKGHSSVTAAKTIAAVIQRPDELTEFLALYWKDGKTPLAHSVKRGLAKAFPKFKEYQLAKYSRDEAIKLRDVMFLVHPKPKDDEQAEVWKRLASGTLTTPDTWEVLLTNAHTPAAKRDVWIGLLERKHLGAMALLKNLRNMEQVNVPAPIIQDALANMKAERVLPFRFISAAQHAASLEPYLEKAMLKCLDGTEKLPGRSVLIVDVSGSMGGKLSSKSELNRLDGAAGLAILMREVCEDVAIYATAGNDATEKHKTELVPARHGFALRDALHEKARVLGGGGIFLAQVCDFVRKLETNPDRVIVFTDEQDCDHKLNPTHAVRFGKMNYLLNVSIEKNGIGYGPWVHFDGFSEAVVDYVRESERGIKGATSNQNA